jgi:hypothetical protein
MESKQLDENVIDIESEEQWTTGRWF